MFRLTVLAFVTSVAIAGTAAASPRLSATGEPCGLSGTFRPYSERIVYDAGGSGAMTTSTRDLVIAGSRWEYGVSHGTLQVAAISPADWRAWRAQPYGPTTKAVLHGWNRADASGPIEGSSSVVDFFWVIYRVGPPVVASPGIVEIKFGHAVVPKHCGAPSQQRSTARLTLSPTSIVAGQSIKAVAGPFAPGSNLDLSETYTLSGKAYKTSLIGGKADRQGLLTFQHDTAYEAPIGRHTLCVTDGQSQACASFYVRSSVSTQPQTTTTSVSHASTSGTTTTTSSGSGGFKPPVVGPGYVPPSSG